jgi:archaellum component FlaC
MPTERSPWTEKEEEIAHYLQDDNVIIKEIDENFVAISNSMQDIDSALGAINTCINQLSDRIQKLEEHVVTIPTPDKILYKPVGHDDYLNIKENLDSIYEQLRRLNNVK